MIIVKKQLLLFVLLFAAATSFGQQANDEAGVRICLENYMSGDPVRVEKAFHPSATMKYVDVQSGEFKDVPIADYIARVKSNATASKTERKIEIVSINVEGSAANAKIKIESGNAVLFDYMNMLRINGEWKIVSKIFNRVNK